MSWNSCWVASTVGRVILWFLYARPNFYFFISSPDLFSFLLEWPGQLGRQTWILSIECSHSDTIKRPGGFSHRHSILVSTFHFLSFRPSWQNYKYYYSFGFHSFDMAGSNQRERNGDPVVWKEFPGDCYERKHNLHLFLSCSTVSISWKWNSPRILLSFPGLSFHWRFIGILVWNAIINLLLTLQFLSLLFLIWHGYLLILPDILPDRPCPSKTIFLDFMARPHLYPYQPDLTFCPFMVWHTVWPLRN